MTPHKGYIEKRDCGSNPIGVRGPQPPIWQRQPEGGMHDRRLPILLSAQTRPQGLPCRVCAVSWHRKAAAQLSYAPRYALRTLSSSISAEAVPLITMAPVSST